MRRRVSLAFIVLACATASAAYAGGGPGAVYTDVARDGKLSCNHSRADLEAALRSGTLNQYGDPVTLARMKLEVRKQLAGGGGCRKGKSSATAAHSGGTGTAQGSGQREAAAQRSGPASQGNSSFLTGRGIVLVLLAVAVALGGWLTKHALSARR